MFARRNLLVLLFVCAVAALTSRPCHAGPDALTDKAAALYDEGMAAYGNNKMPQARAAFLAAWALKHHWQIAASLGDCEVQLGLFRDAAEHLAYSLRLAPAERRSAAGQRLYDTARAKVGSLTVTVDVPGADVAVDGNVIGKAPLEDPLFVEPGHHQIEARSGTKVVSAQVDVHAGAAQTVPLALTRPDPVPPARRSVVPGAVLAGVGGGALVAGIVLEIVVAGKHGTDTSINNQITQAHESCVPGSGNLSQQCATLQSNASLADTLSRAGGGVLVGAGVLGAASLAYFLWPESKPTAKTAGTLRVLPTASPTAGGLLLVGSF